MALPTKDAFTFDHETQGTYPGWTPEQSKENLNKRSEEMRVAFNAVVNILNSVVNGESGSENIASPTIEGITGNTIHAQIADLLAIAQAAQAGTILPGVVTEAMLAFTTATQAELDTHAGLTPATSAHGLDATIAKFKKGNGLFIDNDTAQTFTDAFCTADSLVTISITSVTLPQGTWSVESGAGTFTITSTVAESADITFDYFIQKVV